MAMSCLSAPLVAGGHLNHCNWDSNSNCAIWPRRCKVQLSRVRLRCCRLVSLVRKPLRQRVGSNSCLFRNTDRIVLFGLVLVMLPIPFNLNSWKSSEIIAWTFRLVSCLRADCGFLFDLLFLPNNDAASTRSSRTERSLMFWYRLYQNWKWANVAQIRKRHLLQSMSSLGTKHGSLPVFFFFGKHCWKFRFHQLDFVNHFSIWTKRSSTLSSLSVTSPLLELLYCCFCFSNSVRTLFHCDFTFALPLLVVRPGLGPHRAVLPPVRRCEFRSLLWPQHVFSLFLPRLASLTFFISSSFVRMRFERCLQNTRSENTTRRLCILVLHAHPRRSG